MGAGRTTFALPRALLGMMALVCAAESFIARRSLDFLTIDEWGYRQTRAATRQARGCDLLCLGDSLVKMGVLPRVIEARTGRSSYNLALSAGQATTSALVLRRALESGARPSAILIDFWPPLQRVGPRHNLQGWPYLARPLESAALAWSSGDTALFGSVTLAQLFPSIYSRHAIRSNLGDALAGRPGVWHTATPAYLRNWRVNAGAQVMPHRPIAPGDASAWARASFRRSHCTKTNADALHATLDLAASRGITVYWLLPPVLPDLQALCDESGFSADHERFVRSWQSRYPNLIVLDARRAAYPPSSFLDPNHLCREGAYAYSVALGDLVRHHPPGSMAPRWLTMPPYQPRPILGAFEDVDQSRLALLSRGAARR